MTFSPTLSEQDTDVARSRIHDVVRIVPYPHCQIKIRSEVTEEPI